MASESERYAEGQGTVDFSADYNSSSRDHGGGGGDNTRVEERKETQQEKEITYGTVSVGKRIRNQHLADSGLVSFLNGLLPQTGEESWMQEFLRPVFWQELRC